MNCHRPLVDTQRLAPSSRACCGAGIKCWLAGQHGQNPSGRSICGLAPLEPWALRHKRKCPLVCFTDSNATSGEGRKQAVATRDEGPAHCEGGSLPSSADVQSAHIYEVGEQAAEGSEAGLEEQKHEDLISSADVHIDVGERSEEVGDTNKCGRETDEQEGWAASGDCRAIAVDDGLGNHQHGDLDTRAAVHTATWQAHEERHHAHKRSDRGLREHDKDNVLHSSLDQQSSKEPQGGEARKARERAQGTYEQGEMPSASWQADMTKTKGRYHESARSRSVFEFREVCCTVKIKKDCWESEATIEKVIIQNISARVESGRVMAILGPSGAGKTTLINALTLGATSGRTSGRVELDGCSLTGEVLRERCFVVAQRDFHWAFLTCREVLDYSAALYLDVPHDQRANLVKDLSARLGLTSCEHTLVGNEFLKGLSGGQKRRLSLGVALLKSPDIVFLDEPTSGLDAASAARIMRCFKEVAARDNLIVITTIHQPSTAVFNGFDQVMLLSEGREAFVGDARRSMGWFASLGYPIPPNTNPADHCLDLVNADFAEPDKVVELLDAWEKFRNWHHRGPSFSGSSSRQVEGEAENDHGHVPDTVPLRSGSYRQGGRPAFDSETTIMIQRHAKLALRDPTLYIGRCVGLLLAGTFLSVIHIKSRDRVQDQVLSKKDLVIALIGQPALFAVSAVYGYNTEYNAVRREVKNGMVSSSAYVIANSLLQVPFIVMFSICTLGVPAYAIANCNLPNCGWVLLVHSAGLYFWETNAQLMSILFDSPVMGMLWFLKFWIFAFIFSGWLIQVEDLIWPINLLSYMLPLRYSIRSLVYLEFMDTEFEPCDFTKRQVCFGDWNVAGRQAGRDVLDALGEVTGPFSSQNTLLQDTIVPLCLGAAFKLLHGALLVVKMTHTSEVKQTPASAWT